MPSKEGFEQIKTDEGFHPRAEQQTLQSGKKEKVKTIGYGYNINAQLNPEEDLISVGVPEDQVKPMLEGKVEITKEQADVLFQISVKRAVADASRVVQGFDEMDQQVQDVLVNMSYQLGAKGLREFRKMRRAIQDGDYQKAAKELLNSRYAQSQASNRASRLAKQLVSYGDTAKVPPKPKAPTYQEVVDQQQQTVNKQRLSQTYNREFLKQRLKSAIQSAPPEPKKEDGGVETKSRKEDTPDA